MRRAGVPSTQIAVLFGVTKHTIYQKLRKFDAYHELRETERKQQQTLSDETASLYQKGASTDDVQNTLGWSRSGLDSWRHRRGVYLKRKRELMFDEEEAWRKFVSGASTHALAMLYKVDRIAIVRALKKLHPGLYIKIASGRKGGRKHGARLGNGWDVDQAYAQFKAGDSLRIIGKRYGKSSLTIRAGFVVHHGEEYKRLAAERLADYRSPVEVRRFTYANSKSGR